MIPLPPDFKEILKLLTRHKVEYLLVGGYAVGYHGYPRATGDMDIWLNRHEKTAEKTVQALHDFGFEDPGVNASLFLQEGRIVRMGVPPLRLGIITGISGVEFDDCYSRKVVINEEDLTLHLISLEDLKKNKKAAGRNKDLADLDNLP